MLQALPCMHPLDSSRARWACGLHMKQAQEAGHGIAKSLVYFGDSDPAWIVYIVVEE